MEGEEWRHQVNIIYEVVVQEPVVFQQFTIISFIGQERYDEDISTRH